MGRQRRVEYKGAFYHVVARGNGGEDIVRDDEDRERFERTLEEAIERSGWVLYAWVLMGNHYHFLFMTPEPNLVHGMKWFQSAWTRRFNKRHGLQGHVFAGRYTAIPVEAGDYLTRMIHYIHLNPVRAGLVSKKTGMEGYRWSSLGDYGKPKSKRRRWVAVDQGLESLELFDTAAGRREFLNRAEACVDWEERGNSGAWMEDGESLQSTVRRGWYFGTEKFREKLVKILKRTPVRLANRGSVAPVVRLTRDDGIAEAERLIACAESVFRVGPGDWKKMRKGDWRKGAIAGIVRKRSLVDNGWLAERLWMGACNAVSRTINVARAHAEENGDARRLLKKLRVAAKQPSLRE